MGVAIRVQACDQHPRPVALGDVDADRDDRARTRGGEPERLGPSSALMDGRRLDRVVAEQHRSQPMCTGAACDRRGPTGDRQQRK
jgi:hypothetical protein